MSAPASPSPSRRDSATGPPRKPLPSEPPAGRPVPAERASGTMPPAKALGARTSQSGLPSRPKPPPPSHLRNRNSDSVKRPPRSPASKRQSVGRLADSMSSDSLPQLSRGSAPMPGKPPPPAPPVSERKSAEPDSSGEMPAEEMDSAAAEASPVMQADQKEDMRLTSRPAAASDPEKVTSTSSTSGSWKGATLRTQSGGSRSSAGLVIARTRGSTVMPGTSSEGSNSASPPSEAAVDVPMPQPRAVRSTPVMTEDDDASTTMELPLGKLTSGSVSARDGGGRRWSFLTPEDDAQEGDDAQCYIWGIVGKQARAVPKAPKLGALGEANVKYVVGGDDHFLLLTDSGLVFGWGSGSAGALGHGDTMPRISPTLIDGLAQQHCMCIAAGGCHSAAITDRGTLYNWGSIQAPGIEMSTTPKTRSELKGNIMESVALGYNFVIALVRGGDLIAWGDNSQGQLGCSSNNPHSVNPIMFSLEEKASSVFCGKDAAGAVSLRHSAFYWGANWQKPQKPHRSPQRVVTKCKVESLAFGARHCVLLSTDGRVYVMGDNNRFQLGLPTQEEFRPQFVRQAMSDGMDDEDGSLASPSSTSGSPSVARKETITGSPNLAAASRQTFRFKGLVGGLRRSKAGVASHSTTNLSLAAAESHVTGTADYIRVKQVAAGATHTAVLTTAGKVYEWGQMSYQQEAKETRTQLKPTPIIMEALDGVSIDALMCSSNAVLAVVGLKNEKDLKFLSFNPPIVKAATLERLIDWLIRETRSPTDTFDYHFFLTLRTFTTPEEVLRLLLGRLETDTTSSMETRIVSIVYKWMRKRPKDFFEDEVQNMVKQLVSSAADLRIAISKELSKLDALKRQPRQGRSESQGDSTINAPPLDLLKVDPTAVAEQLTLIEENLVVELDARELLHNAWSKSDKEKRAPHVLQIIASFNRISYYVTTFIVLGTTTEDRSRRAAFWGEVLRHAFQLNNLNTSMAIASAFQSVPFHRLLKRDLLDLKPSVQRSLDAIGGLMKGNKTGYRRKMESILSSGEPAIPYLAVHLSDLTFLEDGNPNYVDDLINMQKRHLIGKQIGPLEKLQSRRYTAFSKNSRLRVFLLQVEGYQETALDHLVEKIIEREKSSSVDGVAALSKGGPRFADLTNRAEQAQMLESEAQATGEERVQVWKEWFLRFSERGADFMQTWRTSRAWELTVHNLLQHTPPGKRETELLTDIMCKMMPGAAPYLPTAVAAILDCARTEPSPELQEKVISTISTYKLAVIDTREILDATRGLQSDARNEAHADIISGLRKDRRRLPRMQLALVATLPPIPSVAELRNVSDDLHGQIPVVEEIVATRKAEFSQAQEEEKEASERVQTSLSELDGRLEGLLQRELELKRELEEVQKQIAETRAIQKEKTKEGEHDMSSIALRKRIADAEVVERTKLIEALHRAADTWERFVENVHLEYVEATHEAHEDAHLWLTSRLDRLYTCLMIHLENVERAHTDVMSRGTSNLLAKEAWKVAREEAQGFLQEAAQFLAAMPAALHELHAEKLDGIVQLREELQQMCEESKESVEGSGRDSLSKGSGSRLNRQSSQQGVSDSPSPARAHASSNSLTSRPSSSGIGMGGSGGAAGSRALASSDSDLPSKGLEPIQRDESDKFILPSQRLVLGPAAPPASRSSTNDVIETMALAGAPPPAKRGSIGGADAKTDAPAPKFSLPSERFTSQ